MTTLLGPKKTYLGVRNPSEALPVLFRGPFSGATGRRPGGANMVATTLAKEHRFWWMILGGKFWGMIFFCSPSWHREGVGCFPNGWFSVQE